VNLTGKHTTPLDLQPTLEDSRVILRPLREADFDALYNVANDPLIWEQHPSHDRYKPDVFDAFFRDAMESRGALIVIDKTIGAVIGSSRFKFVTGATSAVDIGWSFLSRDYWGGAYNLSMKTLMIDHAFTVLDEVIFYVGTENIRSRRAVEKIGGVQLTVAAFPHLVKTDPEMVTYRIHKNDWKP